MHAFHHSRGPTPCTVFPQTLGKSKLKYKRIAKHFDKDKKVRPGLGGQQHGTAVRRHAGLRKLQA